jgi:hypothetical protein
MLHSASLREVGVLCCGTRTTACLVYAAINDWTAEVQLLTVTTATTITCVL